jgi:hypothetical protein
MAKINYSRDLNETTYVSGMKHDRVCVRKVFEFTQFIIQENIFHSKTSVRERTVLTEQWPPVGEVSANCCG